MSEIPAGRPTAWHRDFVTAPFAELDQQLAELPLPSDHWKDSPNTPRSEGESPGVSLAGR